jgi:tetratricopeptide (TPR) repeat protein
MRPVNRTLLPILLMFAVALPIDLVHASPFGIPAIVTELEHGPEASEDESEFEEEDDPKVVEAKAEYRAGSDAYALGNYEEAVAHFERAYELSGQPELLFNLGQSYTRWYDISNNVDHLKKARRLYENYVLNVGATQLDEQGQADARADAQRRIAEVDRAIAKHQNANGTGPVDDDTSDKPVHKKAWFWVAIIGGAAVIGGVAAAVVVTTRPKGFEPELGTIGSMSGGQAGGLTLRF